MIVLTVIVDQQVNVDLQDLALSPAANSSYPAEIDHIQHLDAEPQAFNVPVPPVTECVCYGMVNYFTPWKRDANSIDMRGQGHLPRRLLLK